MCVFIRKEPIHKSGLKHKLRRKPIKYKFIIYFNPLLHCQCLSRFFINLCPLPFCICLCRVCFFLVEDSVCERGDYSPNRHCRKVGFFVIKMIGVTVPVQMQKTESKPGRDRWFIKKINGCWLTAPSSHDTPVPSVRVFFRIPAGDSGNPLLSAFCFGCSYVLAPNFQHRPHNILTLCV